MNLMLASMTGIKTHLFEPLLVYPLYDLATDRLPEPPQQDWNKYCSVLFVIFSNALERK